MVYIIIVIYIIIIIFVIYNMAASSQSSQYSLEYYVDDKILLTSTLIITMVSDICNQIEKIKQLLTLLESAVNNSRDNKFKSIYKEIIDEINDPVMVKLNKLLENKELCVIQETLNRIENDVMPIMSDFEKDCYNEFKKKLIIIPTNPTDRFKELKNNDSKRWRDLNINEFGTADRLGIPILTGNQSATRNILLQKEWDVTIIPHRSRDVVGNKLIRNGFNY